MARRRKRWRKRLSKVAGRTVRAALVIGALIGLMMAISSGQLFMALILMPAMAAGAVVALPFILLALVMAVLAVALPFGILAAVFGGPFYVFHKVLNRAGATGDDEEEDDEELVARLGQEGLLRRRYVAGELTYHQFQTGMLDALKSRFARGEMNVTQYERELQALIEPARVLDTRSDPAVAGAVGRGG